MLCGCCAHVVPGQRKPQSGKIKTSGDCYIVVGGLPQPRANHLDALARLALDMTKAVAGLIDPGGHSASLRIGIGAGPVAARCHRHAPLLLRRLGRCRQRRVANGIQRRRKPDADLVPRCAEGPLRAGLRPTKVHYLSSVTVSGIR
jgi:hypothetical protein